MPCRTGLFPAGLSIREFLMIRIAVAACAAVVVAAFAFPALAQTGDMAKGGAMSNADTCQGMMDKAMPMSSSMDEGNKKMMAMKQMDMAKADMAKGDEKMCMSHMKKAMHDMM
jgi:hypothetical protein